MIVTDYDYEPHRRTPVDLGLDRLVALDGEGEFMGKEQLRAVAADPPNRFVTIRLEGDALPEYGAAVTVGRRGGRRADEPGDEPALGALGLAILRTDVAAPGTEVEVAMPDGGTIGGTVDVLAVLRPERRNARAPERASGPTIGRYEEETDDRGEALAAARLARRARGRGLWEDGWPWAMHEGGDPIAEYEADPHRRPASGTSTRRASTRSRGPTPRA